MSENLILKLKPELRKVIAWCLYWGVISWTAQKWLGWWMIFDFMPIYWKCILCTNWSVLRIFLSTLNTYYFSWNCCQNWILFKIWVPHQNKNCKIMMSPSYNHPPPTSPIMISGWCLIMLWKHPKSYRILNKILLLWYIAKYQVDETNKLTIIVLVSYRNVFST